METSQLFSPIVLANQKIKNRIALAPAGVGLESQYHGGKISTEFVDYFEERAKGGAGLILSCFTAVDERYYCLTLGVYSRDHLPGISRAAEAVQVYGAKFILQIGHFGGKAPKNFVLEDPIAPSSIQSRMYPEVPKEMTTEQVEEVIDLFVTRAEWAREAGCDGVELHGGHGYLLGQFVSPHANRRNDEYGGTLEKRVFIVEKISEGIRKRCGNDFIIGFKFSAHEHLKGGMDTPLAVETAQYMDTHCGLDYLHVSVFSTTLPGFLDCDYPSVPPLYTHQPLVPLAAAIKKKVKNTAIIATGGITDPANAEAILNEGKADMVALGRALIADPYWPNKAKKGESIKYCIKCNTCYKRVLNQQSIKCTVNPYIGEERRYEKYRSRAEIKKKLVVVGAGPAGMEAALTASNRGHRVVMMEKSDRLGGWLRLAGAFDFKFELRKLLEYYEREVEGSEISVRKGIESTPDLVVKENPDAVVLALGSDPLLLPIAGLDRDNVISVTDLIKSESYEKLGKRVVIIGAGLLGCETALFLGQRGFEQVQVVDCLDEDMILSDEHAVNRSLLITKMKKAGVRFNTGCQVKEINDEGVVATLKSDKKITIAAETVVVSAGFCPRSSQCRKFKEKLLSLNPELEVYEIGDCVRCEKLYNAINAGAHAAWRL